MPEKLIDPRLREQLSGGLNAALTEVLLVNETVEAALTGLAGQAAVLTNRRVIIVKGGLSAGAMFGRKAKGYPLEHISSVEYSCALTEGRLQLSVAGTVEQQHGGWLAKGSLLDQVAASRQAENICQFPSNKKREFQALAKLIQSAADERRRAPVAAASDGNIPGQIRQLAALLEQGILTQEEFDAKKRELLARL